MSAVEQSYRGKQVRVFRLNREAILSSLDEAARRLVEARSEVLEVRLFGSLVRGNAGPGSDADVLIVVSAAPQPFLERIPLYARFLSGIGVSCDLFVYTLEELDRLRRDRPGLASNAFDQSRLLARRPPASDPRAGVDPDALLS